MEIVWDERKRQRNIAKHGLDFADLSLDFLMTARVLPAMHDRLSAIGEFQGRLIIAVVFRPLGTEALAVISMRPASRKERRQIDD
ncbi:BrnT family toxin [Ollibium composti]|uniref:BrnT family toxin n=1 Tax=Ollibium composti TaxID=2675109 RepID=A0ABY2QBL1_9HYPH|nr:BrnT family toxin [Mesorhizobium composti]THF59536.1 hypothetical protein E6C48_00280 [Mesorhizobium composti]